MRAAQLVLATSAVIAVISGVAVVNEVRISGGAEVDSFGACLPMDAGHDSFVQVELSNETNGHVWIDSIELGSDGVFVPVGAWRNTTEGNGGIVMGDFPFDSEVDKQTEPLRLVDFAPGQSEKVFLHLAMPEGVPGLTYTEIRANFHNAYGFEGSTVSGADIGFTSEDTVDGCSVD